MRRALVLIPMVLISMVLCAACEGDPSPEARMFLDRVGRLDLDDPRAERERLVENLATMPLSHSEVTEARDVCVDAHRAILQAEALQAHAATLLAGYESDEVPSAGDQRRVRQDIDQADRALARSRDLFSRCHRQTRRLDTRYRRRR